jgi:ABC-type enterochelin transport system permease subunit
VENMKNLLLLTLVSAILITLIPPAVYESVGDKPGESSPGDGETIRVFLADENTAVDMDFREYITGVVAAEMPAEFHEEALSAAACAAAVVSFAGLLGFVGLVVPHMARALVGHQPKKLLPASAVLGAILVVLADLLGRVLFAPSELPVGILMSAIGAPYFLILLCRRKRHAANM